MMEVLNKNAGNFTTFRKLRHILLDMKDTYDLDRQDFAIFDVYVRDYKNYADAYGEEFCGHLMDEIARQMEAGGLDPQYSCMVGRDMLMSLRPFENRREIRDLEEDVKQALLEINEIERIPCRPDCQLRVSAYSEMSYMQRLMLMSHHRARIKESFSIEEMQLCMQEFRKFFDVVRLVNPSEMREIYFDAQGHVKSSEHNCYEVWRKDGRCENCISARSCTRRGSFAKFEFIERDIYFVLSYSVIVDGKSFVLELVKNVNSSIEESMLDKFFTNEDFIARVTRANRSQYRDKLTGLRNRRYYTEQIEGLSAVAIAVLKLDNLKEIEEAYGKETAGEAFKAFALQVEAAVPGNSELVRFEEDEILLMMDYVNYGEFYEMLADLQGKLRWAAENVHRGLELSTSISGVYGYGVTGELTLNAVRTMQVMENSTERLVVKDES